MATVLTPQGGKQLEYMHGFSVIAIPVIVIPPARDHSMLTDMVFHPKSTDLIQPVYVVVGR